METKELFRREFIPLSPFPCPSFGVLQSPPWSEHSPSTKVATKVSTKVRWFPVTLNTYAGRGKKEDTMGSTYASLYYHFVWVNK